MPHARSERPRFTESDVPLTGLARQLRLPAKTILYLASEGHIPLFTRTWLRDATYVSIHESLIRPLGEPIPPDVAELAKTSTIGVTNLGADGMVGFFLGKDDCLELMRAGRVRQRLFPAAVKGHAYHLNVALPNPGYFPRNRIEGLPEEGWRVACYPQTTTFNLLGGAGYPAPEARDITFNNVYARRDDIDIFIDVIDMLGETNALPLLHDVFNEEHVVDDKPAYISPKLVHLIEISERFWRNKPASQEELEAKRQRVRRALQDPDFHSHFNKSKPAAGVLKAAERFIEPVYAREVADEKKAAWPSYLTPELVTLIAASKLYWSPPHVELDKVATHPGNDEIEAYLRIRGITGNEANSALTLIRPPGAAYGRPIDEGYSRPKWPLKRKWP